MSISKSLADISGSIGTRSVSHLDFGFDCNFLYKYAGIYYYLILCSVGVSYIQTPLVLEQVGLFAIDRIQRSYTGR